MAKSRPPYSLEFRQQMVELVRSGRRPSELAREFEPSAQAIGTWVRQATEEEDPSSAGLTGDEREGCRASFFVALCHVRYLPRGFLYVVAEWIRAASPT